MVASENPQLRSLWPQQLKLHWKLGLTLVALICIPRFILVLFANMSGKYQYIGLIMFLSALIPLLLLNRDGLKAIGVLSKISIKHGIFAFGIGITLSLLLYTVGNVLYGSTLHHWYHYIGVSYKIPADIDDSNRLIMFVIMAAVGMSFSPIGEEFFFRGIVHHCFSNSWGSQRANMADSASFALTHLAHFGIVYIHGQWQFLLMPSLIWFLSMYWLSMLFIHQKKRRGSIWSAVLAHSGFNLGMIFCIFYPF